VLAPATVEAVLDRLGFGAAPEPALDGLERVYAAWCRTVPFDNVVKRIHLVSGSASPFPNARPQEFFDLFLAHGTGGTCWPSSRALCALLQALGFDARLASAAMDDRAAGPVHTHGTTIVRADDREYWVDSSMLTDRPLPLVRDTTTHLDHPIRPVRAEPAGRFWRVFWTPAAFGSEMGCLLLDDDVAGEHYDTRYEASRGFGPFNAGLYATRNRAGAVFSVCLGQRCERDAAGFRSSELGAERNRILVEELGYSEEIVQRLPEDDAA
jgi:N-hydroxyarylamine O-acetyltransferase